MNKRHRLPFEILFEDRDIIVVDKPAGLLTTHTKVCGRIARESQPTVENFLNDYVRKGQLKSKNRVWLVHRLDRETSGVMMFAKSEEVANHFRENWQKLTEKTYLARVMGMLPEDCGMFESYLKEDDDGYKVRSVTNEYAKKNAKFSRTEWQKISVCDNTTLLKINLKSGRKNQIRVHFSEAGHPVVGDEKYGGCKASRMYLHSLELKIKDGRHPDAFVAPSPFRN